jgi:hypothetical protein
MARSRTQRRLLDGGPETDPVIEAYKRDVDRTLLRENLKKTPQQRLEELQQLYDFSVELHRSGERLRHR